MAVIDKEITAPTFNQKGDGSNVLYPPCLPPASLVGAPT